MAELRKEKTAATKFLDSVAQGLSPEEAQQQARAPPPPPPPSTATPHRNP